MTVETPTLQPGCIICAGTIPEKKAKFRCLTCSDECAKVRRNARLTPAKYRDLRLHCQVCRGLIPPATAKKGGVTCGTDCRNELRRYRWAILKTQKCPHCYHPSSPAEWERYRRWRANEGPMQAFIKEPAGRGNFAWKREKELRQVLAAFVEMAKVRWEGIHVNTAEEKMEGQTAQDEVLQIIERAEALLPKPMEQATRKRKAA